MRLTEDQLQKRNREVSWWKEIKAQLLLHVPYTSTMQGDTPALTPQEPVEIDKLQEVFFPNWREKAIQDPNVFYISPRVVRLGKINQVIYQIQSWWMLDDEQDVTLNFQLHPIGCYFAPLSNPENNGGKGTPRGPKQCHVDLSAPV